MPPITACPDPKTLQRILLGLEDTIEEVMQHVETCVDCGKRMRAIRAEDDVVAAMRDSPTFAGEADSALVRSMIPVLKCLRPRDTTVTQLASGTGSTFVGVTYSFLGPAVTELELGTLGPYRILDVLGTGGMGVVFLAHDDRLDRRLAVKVIKPALTARADAVQRFLDEARAVAAVEHDNIVQVYEADEFQGTPFLAMPLLRGESLETRLQREKAPLPVADVLRIGRETARGLDAAHGRLLIHRDIKPANLWLDASADGRVKILDFGLAAATKPGEGGQLFDVAGTPAYMAPEQAAGTAVDARADLFSLGCVLYRAATGRPAFRGDGTLETIQSVAKDHPPHPRELNPRLPKALSDLIISLLAKRPDGRPASAREVVDRIDRIIAQRSWLSRRGWVVLVGFFALAVGVTIWKWPDPTPIVNVVPVPVPEDRLEVAPPPRPAFAGELRKHEMHQGTVTAVALVEREDQLLAVSASLDRRVWLWDPTKDVKEERPTPLRLAKDGSFFDAPLQALSVTSDGKRVVVGGGDRSAARGNRPRLWDVPGRKEIPLPFGAQQGLVQALAFAADGPRVVVGGSDGLVSVWDTEKGTALGGYADRDPKRFNLGINAIAVAKSGAHAIVGGGDGSVIVLDLNPIVARKTHYDVHKDGVKAVAIFADGRGFVSGGADGVIRVWDREGGSRQFLGHTKAVNAVALSASGSRLVSGGEDGTLHVWDVERGVAVYELSANTKAIKSVAITADGRHILTGGADGAVRFWRLPPE